MKVAPSRGIQGQDSPQRWWEILARSDAQELPFAGFFAELSAPRGSMNMMNTEAARAQLPSPNTQNMQAVRWGEDGAVIADWFEAGETIAEVTGEAGIDGFPEEFTEGISSCEARPPWELAVQRWVRSFSTATMTR